MLWRSLQGFFRLIWQILDGLRRTVHLFLMLLVLVLLLAVLGSRTVKLPDAFVLIVSPEGALVEQFAGDPIGRALDASRGFARSQTLVSELVEAIDEAAADPRVKAIHLDVDALTGGSMDKLGRVAAALGRFSATGRPVIASGLGLGLPQYYLAAHADEFYLDPLGAILLQGFGFYRNYYKAALEKLSVDWYVFRAGEAKSYGDAFVRNEMSAEERDNLMPIAAGLWSAWRDDVARVRGLEPQHLDDYIEELLPRLRAAGGNAGQAALDAGLVDGLKSAGDLERRLVETGGHDRDGDYVGVYADDYLAAVLARKPARRQSDDRPAAVALVVASGDIMPGEQPPGMIGDDTLRGLLREAREDEGIRALVLRVDSGGGSQFASESIMDELALLRAAGKPLIVSMGGTAASGGYMIALPADEIWAHPTTVTGSIGVVAMMPNFGRLFRRLGVTVDGVGTHRYSGEFRLDREFGAESKALVEALVEGGYDRFLGQVAEARGLRLEEAREAAEGRVWLGQTALDLGLVDRLGTLDDALAAAADLAALDENFEVVLLEPSLSFTEQAILSLVTGATRLGFTAWPKSLLARMPLEIRDLFTELARLDGFADPRGIYTHCFCPLP